MKNHYEILGLEQEASLEDIKKAYRKLSLKFHPDKNEGDAYFSAMFRQVNEAYNVLSDPTKKRAYDQQKSNDAYHYAQSAEALRRKESDLREREEQLRRHAEQNISYRNEQKDTLNSVRSKSYSPDFTIKHLKYLLWIVIFVIGIMLLYKDKNETVPAEISAPVAAKHTHYKHKRKYKKYLTPTKADTTSSDNIVKQSSPTIDTTNPKTIVTVKDSVMQGN